MKRAARGKSAKSASKKKQTKKLKDDVGHKLRSYDEFADLENDVCDLARMAQLMILSDDHATDLTPFTIERMDEMVKVFRDKYYSCFPPSPGHVTRALAKSAKRAAA